MSYQLVDPGFHARLKSIVGKEKPYSWAVRHGIEKAAFARYWRKGTVPTVPILKRISESTGVSIDWLLTGEGSKFKKNKNSDTVQEKMDEFLHYIHDRLNELEKEEPDIRPWFKVEFKKRFPEISKEKKEANAEINKGPTEQNVA